MSRAVLDALSEDLRDPVAYEAYLSRNQEMWPTRYQRLSDAIRTGKPAAAMDAVLSLRSASQMIGAMKLAALALEVEQALRGGQLAAAEAFLDDLEAWGRATMARLNEEFPPLNSRLFGDTDWTLLDGRRVEIQFPGGTTEVGIVDAVTNDGLILWLKQDGVSPRHLIEKAPGVGIRAVPGRQRGDRSR